MYKTKLQETCQRRRWALPRYTVVKDGAEHSPSFSASVFVDGVSFPSPSAARSSKEAQNLAAQFAFFHLISSSRSSSVSKDEADTGELKSRVEEEPDGTEMKSKASSDGPAHPQCFKASVTIGGSTFETPECFKTLGEDASAAAKTALDSLQRDSFHKEDSGLYKNLLQELASWEDLTFPVYKTINSGVPHQPVFSSSVEIDGEVFYGKPGNSKKQAESKAAMEAYKVLKQRAMNPSPKEEATISSLGLNINIPFTSESKKSLESESYLVVSETKCNEHVEDGEDETEISANKALSAGFLPSSVDPNRCPSLTHQQMLPLPVSEPNARKVTDAKDYLLGNRFRVYTCFPSDIAFPKCITVLPVSDNKWVAANLEFLN